MKNEKPAELIEIEKSVPEFPVVMYDLWEIFKELNHTSQVGFGKSPITEQEIQAYCANRRMRLSLFALEAIRKLDIISMMDFSKEA